VAIGASPTALAVTNLKQTLNTIIMNLPVLSAQELEIIKNELGEKFIELIVKQGGIPQDIGYVIPFANKMAGEMALAGINSRSESLVYRLKPTNSLPDASDMFFKSGDIRDLPWNHPATIDERYPVTKIANDAYCELQKVVVGTQESMLKQITDRDRVPAEINYLLTFAEHTGGIKSTWEEMRNKLVTTIDPKNVFDDSKKNMIAIEDIPMRGNSRNYQPQLNFLEDGQLLRYYEGEEVLMLVRFKDLIPE
jgi:hypothetical protein